MPDHNTEPVEDDTTTADDVLGFLFIGLLLIAAVMA